MDTRRIAVGAAAGLAGGLVFGMLMQMMGMMEMVGMLVGRESAVVGWPVHLVNSAVIGAVYGATFGQAEQTWGRGAGFGLAYGALWWVLGALLIMPAVLGMPVFEIGETQIMSLMGHLLYGLVTGVAFTLGVRQAVGEPVGSH